ncbi:MAG TPA: response regulator [Thermoanaerobaculia bacterium]|jgi:CheY-like chemotaxis protein
MSHPKVLIVEDDAAIRALLVAALKREPLEVHVAVDGLEALECVRANNYAVILLDLMMPRVSGYEFLAAYGELPHTGIKPVVFVMTAFDASMVRKLGSTTVHAIVSKPFNVEQVVEMVRDCANVHQQHTAKQDGAGDARSAAPPLDGTSNEAAC